MLRRLTTVIGRRRRTPRGTTVRRRAVSVRSAENGESRQAAGVWPLAVVRLVLAAGAALPSSLCHRNLLSPFERSSLRLGTHPDVHEAPGGRPPSRPLTSPSPSPPDGTDLGGDPLGLLEQRLDELVVRHPADLLALGEQQAAPGPGGDPDVGVRASPGPLTSQPITAICIGGRSIFSIACLDLFGEREHVELGAAARRARHEVERVLADAERLKDLLAELHLFDRVGRERDPDRVADALRRAACRSRSPTSRCLASAFRPRSRRGAAARRSSSASNR